MSNFSNKALRFLPVLIVGGIVVLGGYYSLSRGKILGSADGVDKSQINTCIPFISDQLNTPPSISQFEESDVSAKKLGAPDFLQFNISEQVTITPELNVIPILNGFSKALVEFKEIVSIVNDRDLNALNALGSPELIDWLKSSPDQAAAVYKNLLVLRALDLAMFAQTHEQDCGRNEPSLNTDRELALNEIIEKGVRFVNLDPSDPSRIYLEKSLIESSFVLGAAVGVVVGGDRTLQKASNQYFSALEERFVHVNLSIELSPAYSVVSAPSQLLTTVEIGGSADTKIVKTSFSLLSIENASVGSQRALYSGYLVLSDFAQTLTVSVNDDENVDFFVNHGEVIKGVEPPTTRHRFVGASSHEIDHRDVEISIGAPSIVMGSS